MTPFTTPRENRPGLFIWCRKAGIAVSARGLALALALVLCIALGAAARAQKPPATGGPGFRALPAVVEYLQKTAAANPGITELVEIGRSAGNRPIYVLVVSNMKTGATMDKLVPLRHPRTPAVNNVLPMKPYQGKPGQWIDGGLHGNERVATEACLYIIDKLVAGYGKDAEINRLVDDNAFYVAPVANPDAFTVNDATPAPRTASEANGNFPEGWWKDDDTPGGAGTYPASQPEARWILEFFTNHPNILMVQSFDAGGTTTFRPFARWPENRLDARDLVVLDRLIGRKYLELVGEPVPAAWDAPLTAPENAAATASQGRRGAGGGQRPAGASGRAGGDVQPAALGQQARAWRSAYTNAPAGYGAFVDWAYAQFGAYAMSTQLPDAERDSLPKVCETAWQFERYKATLLPRLEITDATAKVLYTTNQATRAAVTQDGETAVVKKSGAAGRYRIVEVTASVRNAGTMPTGLARSPQLRGNREDVVWLLGDKVTFLEGTRWMRVGVLPGTTPIPGWGRDAPEAAGRGGGGGRGGAGRPELPLAQMRQQRPAETPAVSRSGNTCTVRWLVAVDGDAPLKVALTSERGGTKVKDLAIQ